MKLAAPWLIPLVFGLSLLGAAEPEEIPPFKVGFSTKLFTTVNHADAKAAIKAWAQTVARERGVTMSPSAQLYERVEEMARAMKSGTVDAMSMTFAEYSIVSEQVKTSHWFVTETSGALFEEYIVLVHGDSEITELKALEGRTVLLHESARTSLAMDWLDQLAILTGGTGGAGDFFEEIQSVPKVSAAVLPVFFGNADAAVVAESTFKMMCELNPQLSRTLKTVARSPSLVPAIMCFREDFESPEKEKVITALRELHKTPAGEQVLTIFQSQALVLVDERPLMETAAFVKEVDRLRLEARAGKPDGDRPEGTPDS